MKFAAILVCLFAVIATALPTAAQSASPAAEPAPYAQLDPAKVSYNGPGRTDTNDLPGDTIRIGLLLPLHGPRAAEGQRLLAAAQLALDHQQSANPLPDGRKLALVVRDENERWGQASSDMVQLIEDAHVVALVTLFNGDIAHQAEQVANKLSVPVLTLASDPTTTQANIPWIFRAGPTDAEQARLIAWQIASNPKLRRILLLYDADHDGRAGLRAFHKAMTGLRVSTFNVMEVDPLAAKTNSLRDQLHTLDPDALVLWTSPETTNLIASTDFASHRPVIFLANKAAQLLTNKYVTYDAARQGTNPEEYIYAADSFETTVAQPDRAATQLYAAITLLGTALQKVGPNRARLRDYLSSTRMSSSVDAAPTSFDHAGNLLAPTSVVLTPVGKSVVSPAGEPQPQTNLPSGVIP